MVATEVLLDGSEGEMRIAADGVGVLLIGVASAVLDGATDVTRSLLLLAVLEPVVVIFPIGFGEAVVVGPPVLFIAIVVEAGVEMDEVDV